MQATKIKEAKIERAYPYPSKVFTKITEVPNAEELIEKIERETKTTEVLFYNKNGESEDPTEVRIISYDAFAYELSNEGEVERFKRYVQSKGFEKDPTIAAKGKEIYRLKRKA